MLDKLMQLQNASSPMVTVPFKGAESSAIQLPKAYLPMSLMSFSVRKSRKAIQPMNAQLSIYTEDWDAPIFTAIRLSQYSKAPIHIWRKVPGKESRVRLSQSWNAWLPMVSRDWENVICFSPVQFLKHSTPMFVMLCGRIMVSKLLQAQNRQSLNDIRESGRLTVFKAVQPEKARAPIDITV